jgi:XTP/dITP diphosphohydrolase
MILYITGNQHKVQTANDHLKPFGITVRGMEVDGIIEPQLEDITEISAAKAKQAFQKVRKPLIVSDSGWMITALNGFPGPYMASVNRWFTAQDFFNVMQDKENREIVLRECVTYADKDQLKTFVCDTTGTVLEEASGEGTPLDQVVTFRKDKKSVAKCQNEGILRIPQNELWNDVGRWLTDNGV